MQLTSTPHSTTLKKFFFLLLILFACNTSIAQVKEQCYTSPTNPDVTAKHTWTINNAAGTVTIRTTFSKKFVDNTYGTTAIGWKKGHTFKDLVGSDHVQLALYDASNTKKMEFKIDYISASSTVPSGYKTLGVTGGEGRIIVGNASDVISARTSLDSNLNGYGCSQFTTNSPATDANYSPSAQCAKWIYDVWYEVTVKLSAFPGGFGKPLITSVHASPSKTGNNSEDVDPKPCTPPDPNPAPPSNGSECYGSPTNPDVTATQTWKVNPVAGTVTIRTTFSKKFVDNTYGTNAIGWGNKGHTFNNLVGSDHVQISLFDANNAKKMELKIDYISASNTAPSGYATLGVTGGEGDVITGNESDVISARTSLDSNLNGYGCGQFTTNSPATDTTYKASTECPKWIYDVWYEVTVKLSAFGAAGFGKPSISDVHASPSKTGNNTEIVIPGKCPASIGDFVWDDNGGSDPANNQNGRQDPGEPGMKNIIVALYDAAGNVIKTTSTDANGKYTFTDINLSGGCSDFKIEFLNLPQNYTFTFQNKPGVTYTDENNSDADRNTGQTQYFTLCPGFSRFDIDAGIFNPGSTLPVNLGQLQGKYESGVSLLNWKSFTENNLKQYEVQRSSDGTNFTTIGNVKAAGNSSSTNSYNFIDKLPAAGINFYRLKSIDNNASFSYSNAIAINISIKGVNIRSVYPNPFVDKVGVDVTTEYKQTVELRLTDNSGRVLNKQTLVAQKGTNTFYIENLKSLSGGLYLIEVRAGTERVIKKLSKQ